MNEFEVEILPDGKIRCTSKEGFTQEVHKDADAFLEMLMGLAGGEVVKKKLKPSLGNQHQHTHQHGKGHHHH
jgi:hypothetical protein